MNSPRITVVITIFNGGRHLQSTLESLAAQTFKDFEVLCGDDCSSDESSSLVRAMCDRDDRFRLVSMPRNLGSSPRVMRRLLPEVRGEYMAYSSQDDLFSIDWLECMARRAAETDADGVVPDVEFFVEGQQATKKWIGVRGDRALLLSGRDAAALSLDWTVPGFVLWRTSLVRRVGYSDFSMNADEYTARRLFLAAERIAFSQGTFRYRQDNPDAITKKLSVGSFDLPITHFHTWRLFKTAGYPDELCDSELMRAVASQLYYARRLAGAVSFSESERRDAEARLTRARTALTTPPAVGRLRRLLMSESMSQRSKILLILGPSAIRRQVAERTRIPSGQPR